MYLEYDVISNHERSAAKCVQRFEEVQRVNDTQRGAAIVTPSSAVGRPVNKFVEIFHLKMDLYASTTHLSSGRDKETYSSSKRGGGGGLRMLM